MLFEVYMLWRVTDRFQKAIQVRYLGERNFRSERRHEGCSEARGVIAAGSSGWC